MTVDATDVVVSAIGTAGLVLGPIMLLVVQRRLGRIESKRDEHGAVLEEVREQVSNDHDTNLRHDVDDLRRAVDQLDANLSDGGRLIGRLSRDVRTALDRIGSHDAASALIVGALRDADDQLRDALEELRAELRQHHP